MYMDPRSSEGRIKHDDKDSPTGDGIVKRKDLSNRHQHGTRQRRSSDVVGNGPSMFSFDTPPRKDLSPMTVTFSENNFYSRRPSQSARDENDATFMNQALLPPSPHSPSRPSLINHCYSIVSNSNHQPPLLHPSSATHKTNYFTGSRFSKQSRKTGNRRPSQSCLQSSKMFLRSIWIKKDDDKGKNTLVLILAIMCWYSLGIVSITSSKILLGGGSRNWNIPPMVLTCQQFGIGSSLLSQFSSKIKNDHYYLMMTGACFSFGFWLTNVSFFESSATFVETVKAAEPISSATIAMLWGIESNISFGEIISLLGITCGLILSTVGNVSDLKNDESTNSGLKRSVQICATVLLANFCFSFRGMYQKLYRKNQKQQLYSNNTQIVSDADLQYSMQSWGFRVFIVPAILGNGFGTLQYLFQWFMKNIHNSDTSKLLIYNLTQDTLQYTALALLNGLAFTGYNLASTFVLSRISVVHHAAVNCVRRVFAIVVTSIVFQVPISFLSACGIIFSIISFLSYTRFKTIRITQPLRLSSLLPINKE